MQGTGQSTVNLGGPPGLELDDEQCCPPTTRQLSVVFELSSSNTCFMRTLDGDIAGVQMHFSGSTCHCDVTVRNDETSSVVHHSRGVCGECPGAVFSRYGCPPRVLDFRRDRILVEVHLEDTDALTSLVTDLKAVCRCVQVRRIETNSEGSASRFDVDVTQLTDKQRDALRYAVERGYYECPAQVSLATLADDLGITPSALSQRLSRAERTVLTQLFANQE